MSRERQEKGEGRKATGRWPLAIGRWPLAVGLRSVALDTRRSLLDLGTPGTRYSHFPLRHPQAARDLLTLAPDLTPYPPLRGRGEGGRVQSFYGFWLADSLLVAGTGNSAVSRQPSAVGRWPWPLAYAVLPSILGALYSILGHQARGTRALPSASSRAQRGIYSPSHRTSPPSPLSAVAERGDASSESPAVSS